VQRDRNACRPNVVNQRLMQQQRGTGDLRRAALTGKPASYND